MNQDTDLLPEEQASRQASVTRLGIMIDSETMGLGTNAIIRELAFLAFDLDDPNHVIKEVFEELPLKPQKQLGIDVELDTIGWLLDQPKSVHDRFKRQLEGDGDELMALIRSFNSKFRAQVTGKTEVEVWFARPQFDIPVIKNLYERLNEELPWSYDKVQDLRTLMKQVGMPFRGPELDEFKKGLVLHTADGDCRYQLRCYIEARRRLKGNL